MNRDLTVLTTSAFPSGHTAEAFLSAEFLMQEYKNHLHLVWHRGYAVATSVAYLRMYNVNTG
jgi:hypothetical protein